MYLSSSLLIAPIIFQNKLFFPVKININFISQTEAT